MLDSGNPPKGGFGTKCISLAQALTVNREGSPQPMQAQGPPRGLWGSETLRDTVAVGMCHHTFTQTQKVQYQV